MRQGQAADAGQAAYAGGQAGQLSPQAGAGEAARLLRTLVGAANEAASRVFALFERGRRRWRSSLQLRVVSTTLVVSLVVVSVLGFFLIQQIRENLLQNAERSALIQAGDGLSWAQAESGIFAARSGQTRQLMQTIVRNLEASDENPSAQYGIAVILPPGKNGPPVDAFGYSVNLNARSLPRTLVRQLSADPGMSPAIYSASLRRRPGCCTRRRLAPTCSCTSSFR